MEDDLVYLPDLDHTDCSQCDTITYENVTCGSVTCDSVTCGSVTCDSVTSEQSKSNTESTESTHTHTQTTESIYEKIKSIPIFQSLDKSITEFSKLPWVEEMTKELNRTTLKFNQNTNENLQILKNDLKNLNESFKTDLGKMVGMTACEIREKAIQEFYNQIKLDVYSNRCQCKCVCKIETTSNKILQALVEKLEDEGFEIKSQIKEDHIVLTLEW
jgi:hypothetical protein